MNLWRFLTTLAAVLVTISVACAQAPNCELALTYGYGYEDFFPIVSPPTGISLLVQVKTIAYARILLGQNNSTVGPYILITLGDNSNTGSTITDSNGNVLIHVDSCGELSDAEYRGYYITYIGGRVEVRREYESAPFMTAVYNITVNSAGFGSNYHAYWLYSNPTTAAPLAFETDVTKPVYYTLIPSGGGGGGGVGTDVSFGVRASSDIIVLFSHVIAPLKTDPVYEVLIGATNDNTELGYTTIRRFQEGADLATKQTPNLLDNSEFRCFRVTVEVDASNYATVSVYKDGDGVAGPPFVPELIFQYRDEQGSIPVAYYSVSSNFDEDAVWHFPCGCVGGFH